MCVLLKCRNHPASKMVAVGSLILGMFTFRCWAVPYHERNRGDSHRAGCGAPVYVHRNVTGVSRCLATISSVESGPTLLWSCTHTIRQRFGAPLTVRKHLSGSRIVAVFPASSFTANVLFDAFAAACDSAEAVYIENILRYRSRRSGRRNKTATALVQQFPSAVLQSSMSQCAVVVLHVT
jgi:hypothetical protein